MIKGIVLSLCACAIWGLVFVIPQFMQGYSPVEVVLGRYLFYGVISAALLVKGWPHVKYPRALWVKALWFAFISNIVYYISVVLSLRYATPAICTLIIGTCPLLISF